MTSVPMAWFLTLTELVVGVHLATLDLHVPVRATPFPNIVKFVVNACLKA